MGTMSKSSISTDWPADAIPRSWIEKLFVEMLAAYGKKFTDQWAVVDGEVLKRHWAMAMHTLSVKEITHGVQAMRQREWPPTLPEFLKLCRPPIDPLVAYYQAVNGIQARERGEVGEWPHPAIYWAMVKVGAFDLKNLPYSLIKGRWEKILQAELERDQWADIPAPLIALPAPEKTVCRPPAVVSMVERMRLDGAESGRGDSRRWAKDIMRRLDAGDKTLTLTAIDMAREALASPQYVVKEI